MGTRCGQKKLRQHLAIDRFSYLGWKFPSQPNVVGSPALSKGGKHTNTSLIFPITPQPVLLPRGHHAPHRHARRSQEQGGKVGEVRCRQAGRSSRCHENASPPPPPPFLAQRRSQRRPKTKRITALSGYCVRTPCMLYPFLYSIQNDRSISRLVGKSQLASYHPSNYFHYLVAMWSS